MRWVALLVICSALLLAPAAAQAQADPSADGPAVSAQQGGDGSGVTGGGDTGGGDTDGEVRLAIYGLLGIALVTAVSTVFYWRHTGREARQRFDAGPPPPAVAYEPAEQEIYLEHIFEIGQRNVAASRGLPVQR